MSDRWAACSSDWTRNKAIHSSNINKAVCLLLVLFTWLVPIPAAACTLWAAAGQAAGGGTIIAKNRDWAPDHTQELRLEKPVKGLAYYGLFAVGGSAPGLKAGLNEKGLVVVTASASSIPTEQRRSMAYTKNLAARLLAECQTVDDVLNRVELFRGPQFLLLADRTKTACIEIGPGGAYTVRSVNDGPLFHTNHYLSPELAGANVKIGASSRERLGRIGVLLSSGQPYGLTDFVRFSMDQAAGPTNSIWRTGRTPSGERTLATWIVALPPGQAPQIYVRLANPGESIRELHLQGTDVFR